jgi:translation initiation factor 6
MNMAIHRLKKCVPSAASGTRMGISTGDVFGSDQIGVFLAVVGKTVFHPLELEEDVVETIESTLGLETKGLLIGGSRLIGSLLAGNNYGLAVADLATEKDIEELTSYGDVIVMESGINTAGNLLVCTDSGILASPELPDEGLEILGDVMKADVGCTTVAGQAIVGSLAAANSKGIILHPDVRSDEIEVIQQVLDVPPMVGTVARGSPFIGSGMVCSDSGAFTGKETTGPELNRIEDALGLI